MDMDVKNFTKELIEELKNEGLFSDNLNFIDEEPLYNELLPIIEKTYQETGELDLSDEDFENALIRVRHKSYDETIESLIIKDLIVVSGIDKENNITYVINKNFKKD
jgi:hypothetical protein